MKLSGSQIIVKILEAEGITTVAGIPGGYILPFYDELVKSSIKHVLVRHEQAAGFVAQGFSRTQGKPGVCIATSGPGAMNLLTAIADARCDSIPLIAFTGQVNTSLIGTDSFQEADTFGLSLPITKHSVMVKDVHDLLRIVPDCFEIAASGRPGPVLIDLPKDVQLAVIDVDEKEFAKIKKRAASFDPFAQGRNNRLRSSAEEVSKKTVAFADALYSAKQPVLYLGGGAANPQCEKAVREFLKIAPMPVVSSLMGIGVVPHEESLGMVGMHGSYVANVAMEESDLVFTLGSRFDDRAAGLADRFCPKAKILHIDVDAAEIGKILPAALSLVYDIQSALPLISQKLKEKGSLEESVQKSRKEWMEKLLKIKAETDEITIGRVKTDLPNPREFIAGLPQAAKTQGLSADDLIVATDVGQHQMWTAQVYPVSHTRQLLTSGSLGTMGFGLPTAIGAALANPEKRIICVSGDGSILMNVQEMATLSEQNLNVTVIVLENGVLGMVRQQQKFNFKRNFAASIFPKNPDFMAVAQGFGIPAVDAGKDKDWVKTAFPKKGPAFVRLVIDPEEDVLPYVKPGHENTDSYR